MAKITKWPSVFFHGQHISKIAKFFEIGHEMANLVTLVAMSPGAEHKNAFSFHSSHLLTTA